MGLKGVEQQSSEHEYECENVTLWICSNQVHGRRVLPWGRVGAFYSGPYETTPGNDVMVSRYLCAHVAFHIPSTRRRSPTV
jgi:hypothetical protein